MNILILTYGSRGDVQPYVALGKKLQADGYRVTLATSNRFQDFVEDHELNYAHMNDDLLAILDTDEGKDLLEKGSNFYQLARRGLKIAKQVKPANKSLLRESWQVAQAVNPDLIIFHPKAGAAPHIAEKMGIKAIMVTPVPMLVPTKEFPAPGLPDLNLGGWYRRIGYAFVRFVTIKAISSYIRDFRAEIDLPPLKKYSLTKSGSGKNIHILHAHSPVVLPRPSDWPNTAHVTGYLFLDGKEEWTPSQELLDFLNAGEPPVYIGFGSMVGRNPERLALIVTEALQKAGLRGIIATGWGGLKAKNLPDTIFNIEQVSHHWLLPKVSAVVHHGGAGTTAAGLRAGKPSIIVPFFADQPFWGWRVHKIGAGPKPIIQKKLSADLLATALQEATGDQAMKDAAMNIGHQIKRENGLANAITMIEKICAVP